MINEGANSRANESREQNLIILETVLADQAAQNKHFYPQHQLLASPKWCE
jgi:hypothetical protein